MQTRGSIISEGVVLEEVCSTCGASVRASYVQNCLNGKLSWSASIRCAACGDRLEVDGGEELPELLGEAGAILGGFGTAVDHARRAYFCSKWLSPERRGVTSGDGK
jgi:hypothetical protein